MANHRADEFNGTYPAGAGINPKRNGVGSLLKTYPAGAGINLTQLKLTGHVLHLPRRRGDKPYADAHEISWSAPTPQARG